MGRLRKVVVIAFTAVAALIVLFVVGLRCLPETDLVRNSLQTRLSELTGEHVSLGSMKISVSFPKLIHLRLDGVSITSREGKSLISVDKLVLSPSLSRLFKREVSVQSVTVSGLRAFLRRARGGSIESIASVPGKDYGKSRSEASTGEQTPSIASPQRAEVATPVSPQTARGAVKWSVDSIRLVDARIDWADSEIVPGQTVTLSLKNVDGSLIKDAAGPGFGARFKGLLVREDQKGCPVNVDGQIVPTEDFSGLNRAKVNVKVEQLALRVLDDYVPTWARRLEQFDEVKAQANLDWEKTKPAKIAFRADISAREPSPARVSVQGDMLTSENLSQVREIKGTVESDSLPFKFLKDQIPKDLPLDPDKGTLKGRVQGEWKLGRDWSLRAGLGLDGAVPVAAFNHITDRVRISLNAQVFPDKLNLENLDVSGREKLVSMHGTVSRPFSEARVLDLQGEAACNDRWLVAFGIKLPPGVAVNGPVPLRARIQGPLDDIWLDLKGDLARARLAWLPYLEKAPGRKGHMALKGKIHPSQSGNAGKLSASASASVGLSGATMRLVPDGPKLTEASVHLDSKVLVKAADAELKDATVTVMAAPQEKAFLTLKANVTDLRAPSPKVNGSAKLNVDKTLLLLTGFGTRSGVQISGNAPLNMRFQGSRSALDWSMDLSLTPLDIAVDRSFRKAGGVPGDLKAKGKLALDEITLVEGSLTVPGLAATAKGDLRDRNGKFRGLTIDVKQSELKKLSALIPPISGKGLSGPVEAKVRLSPLKDSVSAAAIVRLLGVDYRPEKAQWSLDQIKGNVEILGTSADFPGLTARLLGTVEAPVKVKGTLNDIKSLDNLSGAVAVDIGPGRLKADQFKNILNHTQLLLGTILNPGEAPGRSDPLQFQSLSANFHIKSGTARTENLKLKGTDLNIGAIGSLRLGSMDLDALAGIRTVTVVPAVLGKIPQVKKLVKQHEDILKATGLDKTLKRLGIDAGEPEQGKTEAPTITKTPVTVIVKLQGHADAPHVSPVLETGLNKGTAARLKSLME